MERVALVVGGGRRGRRRRCCRRYIIVIIIICNTGSDCRRSVFVLKKSHPIRRVRRVNLLK